MRAELLQQLADYLHPISGGNNGQGFPFGQGPQYKDLFAILETQTSTLGARLTQIRFSSTQGETFVVRSAQDPQPNLPTDVLTCDGGNHQFTFKTISTTE